MTRPDASDVLVVGGGIVGASAAFFLRQRGRTVTLLETGLVGQQASGVNYGNVRRQGRPLKQLPLANRASPIWRRLKALLGEDVEYLEAGHLRVCHRDRPEIAASFERYAQEARETGLELELLGGRALRERFPFLGPDVLAGSFSARDGHANPRLVAPAFGRAAGRAGATIVENAFVSAAEKIGEDFQVLTRDGRVFRAPVLLIAAGAWAPALTAQFGEAAPITPRGPTISVTEPVPYSIAPSVTLSTPIESEVVYFRQVKRGNIVIGGGMRGPSYAEDRRAYVLPQNTLGQLRQVQRLAPALGRLHVIRTWSGIEGYMPDELPVMGASRTTSGLFHAFGFSGAGFQTGPAVGDVMAELIDTGATTTPLDYCSIGRFDVKAVA